jgi:uncharacterized membrane protein
MKLGRLEAFSDGVLAIAITLLVLDLHLPASDKPIGSLLADEWPSYFAYLVSFTVIGIMWVNHHGLFRLVKRLDRGLVFLNLALLLAIAALPFPTSVAAEGIRRGGQDAKVAMFAYGVAMVLVSIAFCGVWSYIVFKPAVMAVPLAQQERRIALGRFSGGLVGYAALCGLAFLSPIAALIGHGLLAIYYSFERLPDDPSSADGE